MFTRLQAIFSLLRQAPLEGGIYLVSFAAAILTSLILHECAHGYVALHCGDPTAKMMGRLSLNPLKHLDPLGTVFMVLFGFGWAKPVPVNPRNFRDFRRDDFLVSIAGIVMNLTLFLLTTALMVGFERFANIPVVFYEYGYIAQGGHAVDYVLQLLYMLSSINLSLAIFNLLPIPPLDGYHLVNDTLLKGRFRLTPSQFQTVHVILMVVCFSGVLNSLLSTVHGVVYDAVMNLFHLMIP